MNLRSLPIFLAFFVMGFVNSVGALVGYAREQFHLTGLEAGLLPFFGFAAFALASVPAGVLVDRRGKKPVLVLGLALVVLGEVLPFFFLSRYEYLLAAIFLIGVGMTVLQVAGNPIMRDVSPPGAFARNLTFAQFAKSVGGNAAPYLLPMVVAAGWGWKGMFPVFAAVAAVTLVLVARLRVDEGPKDESRATLGSSFALLRDPFVTAVVFGIFLYVGAEVGLNAWIATHLTRTFGMDSGLRPRAPSVSSWAGWRWEGSSEGSSLVLRLFPSPVLGGDGFRRVRRGSLESWLPRARSLSVRCSSRVFAFSNVWPLVFSIAIEEPPADAPESFLGLMCMAIFGGALLPLGMGSLCRRRLGPGGLCLGSPLPASPIPHPARGEPVPACRTRRFPDAPRRRHEDGAHPRCRRDQVGVLGGPGESPDGRAWCCLPTHTI